MKCLENWRLEMSKKVRNKSCYPNPIFLSESNFKREIDHMIFSLKIQLNSTNDHCFKRWEAKKSSQSGKIIINLRQQTWRRSQSGCFDTLWLHLLYASIIRVPTFRKYEIKGYLGRRVQNDLNNLTSQGGNCGT